MAVISQIIRFILPQTKTCAAAFTELRRRVASNGAVKAQYYGYVIPNEGFPRQTTKNQMCWYIEWSKDSKYRTSDEFGSELVKVAAEKALSIVVELTETKSGEIIKGIESKVCQFAIINLVSKSPRFETKFEHSMDKTFTDCYFAKGFTGGGWGYVMNSNDANGVELTGDDVNEHLLEDKDKRLAYYVIGWNSLEDHHAFAKTELYAEELAKLGPYFAPGSGAFYVNFEQES